MTCDVIEFWWTCSWESYSFLISSISDPILEVVCLESLNLKWLTKFYKNNFLSKLEYSFLLNFLRKTFPESNQIYNSGILWEGAFKENNNNLTEQIFVFVRFIMWSRNHFEMPVQVRNLRDGKKKIATENWKRRKSFSEKKKVKFIFSWTTFSKHNPIRDLIFIQKLRISSNSFSLYILLTLHFHSDEIVFPTMNWMFCSSTFFVCTSSSPRSHTFAQQIHFVNDSYFFFLTVKRFFRAHFNISCVSWCDQHVSMMWSRFNDIKSWNRFQH